MRKVKIITAAVPAKFEERIQAFLNEIEKKEIIEICSNDSGHGGTFFFMCIYEEGTPRLGMVMNYEDGYWEKREFTKSGTEIRQKCKELYDEYNKCWSKYTDDALEPALDIALARFQALNWVFEDEE
jgi:hypothetical protein